MCIKAIIYKNIMLVENNGNFISVMSTLGSFVSVIQQSNKIRIYNSYDFKEFNDLVDFTRTKEEKIYNCVSLFSTKTLAYISTINNFYYVTIIDTSNPQKHISRCKYGQKIINVLLNICRFFFFFFFFKNLIVY
jgi:hypothetical protein